MKTVTFYRTATGEITGTATFHDDYLVAVPDGEACLQGAIDGAEFYVVDGVPVAFPPRPYDYANFDFVTGAWIDSRSLDRLKMQAQARLFAWVEAERRLYVTALPGQEMIYLAKEAEAARFLVDPDPDMASYPFIAAEVGITAQTAWQVAQIWAFMATLWREVAAELEQTRLGLSAQIAAATTPAELADIIIPSTEEPLNG